MSTQTNQALMTSRQIPQSCDTFVVLPPVTLHDCVIFGKNSDRPQGEVQEVLYVAADQHEPGETVQCTYMRIPQAAQTHAVILSKPSWMWGAEMGANDAGVCIGNEAVYTKLQGDADLEEKLLGMDLVRLGLERSSTAREAVDVLTGLLEEFGQGGRCSDALPNFTYHNSFLIADHTEAWILETAGHIWAAERITTVFRNLSNCLSIGTKMDLMSKELKEHAQSNGFWDPSQGELNFAQAYGQENQSMALRLDRGKELLSNFTQTGEFSTLSMFEILRDCDSEICRGAQHEFPTAGSQVSVLAKPDSGRSSCHWFTGTPDPAHSVFKPFVFCSQNRISKHIISPTFPDNQDPVKMQPRFQSKVDRSHTLYRKHKQAYPVLTSGTTKGKEIVSVLRRLECQCVADMEGFVANFTTDKAKEVEDLFKDLVESEIKFYYIK